jgi:hypothetical protein
MWHAVRLFCGWTESSLRESIGRGTFSLTLRLLSAQRPADESNSRGDRGRILGRPRSPEMGPRGSSDVLEGNAPVEPVIISNGSYLDFPVTKESVMPPSLGNRSPVTTSASLAKPTSESVSMDTNAGSRTGGESFVILRGRFTNFVETNKAREKAGSKWPFLLEWAPAKRRGRWGSPGRTRIGSMPTMATNPMLNSDEQAIDFIFSSVSE